LDVVEAIVKVVCDQYVGSAIMIVAVGIALALTLLGAARVIRAFVGTTIFVKKPEDAVDAIAGRLQDEQEEKSEKARENKRE
jgi:hypothetical protein